MIYYAHDKIEKRESHSEDGCCVLCAGPRRARSGAAVRTQVLLGVPKLSHTV